MKALLILPVLIPLLTGIACLGFWGRRAVQRALSVAGAAALLVSGLVLLASVSRHGIQAVQIGGWPAPCGVTFVADLLSAIMVAMAGLMGLAVSVYSLSSIDADRELHGYYPLLHILLVGVNGAFLTGDIFNLFVWYEVMLMASFALMALGGERSQLKGAIKYVTLNLMSSILFLTAVGVLYGATGTLNMADLAVQVRGGGTAAAHPGVLAALAMLFLVAFGIKAAIFPLFAWLPASYHTPPIAVTVILSALLTKVGVYSLIRVFTLLFVHETGSTHSLLLVLAGLTMVTGVLGAVAQYDVRRLLSFHIISQIGYLLMGLGLFTPLALAAAVFFMIHVILAKSALFMVSGAAHRVLGTYDLKQSGGLYRTQPLLTMLFLVPAMALAGVPPLSGFFAKLALVQAGLATANYAIVATALGVSLLTLFSMTKIWAEVFWKPLPVDLGRAQNTVSLSPLAWTALLAPTAAVGLLTIVIGIAAEPLFALLLRASAQLIDPSEYIHAVLGGGA